MTTSGTYQRSNNGALHSFHYDAPWGTLARFDANARNAGNVARIALPQSWLNDDEDGSGDVELDQCDNAHIGFARQPIVDSSGNVYAFELLFRSAASEMSSSLSGAHQTAAVMCAAVFGAGLREAANGLPIWINVDAVTLLSPVVEALTGTFAVIELHEGIVMTAEVVARIKKLREMGHHFALDNLVHAADPRLCVIDEIEYLKVDVSQAAAKQIHALLALGRIHSKRMLAEKVESSDEQLRLFAMGFEFVQGFACGRPVLMAAPKLPGCNPAMLFRLYLLAENGASAQALALNLMRDPGLAARLFLLCGVYSERKLGLASLTDLINGMSRNVLLAWFATLMAGCTSPYSETWCVDASTMARSLQLLARQLEPNNIGLADRAFLLGLVANFRQSLRHVFTDSSRVPRLSDELEAAAALRCNRLGLLLEYLLGREVQPSGWHPFGLTTLPVLREGQLESAFQDADRWARLQARLVSPSKLGVPTVGMDRPLVRVKPDLFNHHLSQLWGGDVGAMAGRLARGQVLYAGQH